MTLRAGNRLFSGFFAAIFAFASLFSTIFLINVQAQAETPGSGLRIPPGPISLEILPGESTTIELPVKNIVPTDLNVTVEVNDFESDGKSGDPVLVLNDKADPNNPYSLRPYVTGPFEFTLAQDEERTLKYTIALPEDAKAGSRYGLFRFLPTAGEKSSEGISLSASLGTIVMVTTPGEVKEIVEFVDMWAQEESGERGSLFQDAPQKLIVRLKNQGDTFVQPFGTVVIKNWKGDTVLEYEFNEAVQQSRPGMLPQSEREFDKLLENIDGYGKYTVEANISYGNGSNIIPASLTFWVMPWKIVLFAIVAIVLAIAIITRGVRWYNRRLQVKEKSKSNKK